MKLWSRIRLNIGVAVGLSALALSSQAVNNPTAPAATTGAQTLSKATNSARPLDPWVLRSVLDGQPRIVTVALHDNLFIAFDAAHAGLYKAWKGGVNFDGAVYTSKHGPQPTANGYAYYEQKLRAPVWLIEQDGKSAPATVKFGGYKFVKDKVVFQYDLITANKTAIHVEETPEYIARKKQAGLQRDFVLSGVPAGVKVGLQTAFTSLQSAKDFSTNANFVEGKRSTIEHGKGKTLSVEGVLWLNSQTPTNVTVFYHPGFDGIAASDPKVEAKPQGDHARAKQVMGGSDCTICHNPDVKTVGPAYKDIASRYDKSDSTIDKLAQKIIKGGNGVWGDVPMTAHPDLLPDDARLVVAYILSLKAETAASKTEGNKTEADKLFLEVPSRAFEIDTKPKGSKDAPKVLKPGLAVAAAHIEDFVTQTFSQTVLSGVAPVVHAHELKDLGAITTNVRMLFSGYLQVEKAGTYGLRLITDDGGRMKVNGVAVVDRWQFQGATPNDVKVELQQGLNAIEIEYFQGLAGGSISLQWLPPGATALAVIPEANLRHYPQQVAEPVPYIPRKELVRSIPGDKTPLEAVHPSFTVAQARPDWFEPMVGGMDFFSDGRLALCAWDGKGSVYMLEGVQDRAPKDIGVKLIASGLGECLGLKVVDDQLFVMQKHELTQLVDNDGDGAIEEYRTISNQWRASANFHEFAFGLGYDKGYFYATLATAIEPGGASTQPQIPDRGKAIKISRADGSVEFVAHGLRTPNGIGKGVDGEFFIADNQGDWLPASKILHLKPGAFYGSRSVNFAGTEGVPVTQPVVWLPQDEIGNSPSQPTYINQGDYAGQMLHGEVTHGGLKRVFAEKVNGDYQGAVFRFTQGLEAGINRVAWAPDGKTLYVGGVGNPGNWSHNGKAWYGLQKLSFNGKQAFEMLKVSARSNGMELEFTQPLELGRGITAAEYQVQQWYYLPTSSYGGDKKDLQDLKIVSVNISKDRKKVFLELEGMKPGHVVYIRLAEPFSSASNQSLWSTEAWYTLNAIPANKPGFRNVVKPQAANKLSADERKAGWKLLFDGKTTKGWRTYSSDKDKPKVGAAWKVVDGSLHLDPAQKQDWQTVNGGDIITNDVYENYELAVEWKLAAGGNSGLIYGVVEGPEYSHAWKTGPEYQFLDNPGHPDGAIKTHRAGDLYDFISSQFVAVNKAGEWNRTRLVVNHGKVEHWLNGYKVVEYDQSSPAWKEMIARSKFANMPNFGQSRSGHIALQDHGDAVWFKNIKLRKLE